jgi:hypothetical protein
MSHPSNTGAQRKAAPEARRRLAHELANLHPEEEKGLAEEGLSCWDKITDAATQES